MTRNLATSHRLKGKRRRAASAFTLSRVVGVLFSHPRTSPVCTTELGYMARLKPEFESGTRESSASASIRSRTRGGRTTSRKHRARAGDDRRRRLTIAKR
jgi:hypothetical protein